VPADQSIEEAKRIGAVNIVGSSKDKKWSYLPEITGADPDADYFTFATTILLKVRSISISPMWAMYR
jgi:hypothetical protein